jgi:glycosyltransferase involved in cell wall biosynthesis
MKIVYLTDMDLKGSGYLNLSVPLCNGLVRKGHQVKAVGLGYTGEEHPNDFSIIPARSMPDALGITQNLSVLDKFDVLIVAMDIPIQEAILQRLPTPRPFKYVGIMPVEADPLCLDWAMVLAVMDQALVISEFGTEEAHKSGVVKAEHLQIGIDTNAWRIPHKEERDALRLAYGIEPDCFTVLTVADNQERKNLSVSMEMFAEFAKDKPKTKYVLVTREHNAVGWKLRNLAQTLGIAQKLLIFERGMSFKELWGIYAASDCFLLASKAEGLGVILMEAMAVGLPCISTNCTGAKELLADGRGCLIPYDYVHIDPFGNGHRYWASVSGGAFLLNSVYNGTFPDTIAARKYVEGRSWDIPIDHLDRVIQRLKK